MTSLVIQRARNLSNDFISVSNDPNASAIARSSRYCTSNASKTLPARPTMPL
jgi:hypothetical protein